MDPENDPLPKEIDPAAETVLALTVDGTPMVMDDVHLDPLPVWEEGVLSLGRGPSLSPDGQTVALCSQHGYADYGVYVGPVGELDRVSETDMYCSNIEFSVDGTEITWIDYGPTTSPHNLIRIMDLAGNPVTGDALGGDTQAWGPHFIEGGEAVLTVYSSSDDIGPLWRLDRESGDETQLTAESGQYPWALSRGEMAAYVYAYSLYTYDVTTGEELEVVEFPSFFDGDDCDLDDPDATRFCFYKPATPSWDAAGQRIVFAARPQAEFYGTNNGDLLVYDTISQELTRITDDGLFDWVPVFDGSGQWLYWLRGESGMSCLSGGCALVRAPADGSGEPEVLVEQGADDIVAVWPQLEIGP